MHRCWLNIDAVADIKDGESVESKLSEIITALEKMGVKTDSESIGVTSEITSYIDSLPDKEIRDLYARCYKWINTYWLEEKGSPGSMAEVIAVLKELRTNNPKKLFKAIYENVIKKYPMQSFATAALVIKMMDEVMDDIIATAGTRQHVPIR